MVLGSLCMLSKEEQKKLKLQLYCTRHASTVKGSAGVEQRRRRKEIYEHKMLLRQTNKVARQMGLPAEEVVRLKRLFDEADSDGGGEIDLDELVGLCKVVRGGELAHLSKWDLAKYLNENDSDGSGKLGFDEFLALVSPRREAFRKLKQSRVDAKVLKTKKVWQRMHNARNRYAWNLYGNYMNQIQRFGRKMGYSEKDLQQHIRRFEDLDTDGSGELDVDELAVLLRSLGESSRDDLTRNSIMNMMKPFDWKRVGRIDLMGFLEMMSPRRQRAQNFKTTMKNERSRKLQHHKQLMFEAPERRALLESKHEDAALKRWTRKLGFGDTDVETLREQFNSFDLDGSGEIDLDELCNMLHMNNKVPAHLKRANRHEVAKLLSEYDHNNTATIDFREFLHMVSPRRERFWTQEQRRAAARRAKAQQKAVSFDNARYKAAISRWNQHLHRLWRHGRNMGFSDREIEELKAEFDRYDVDGSGDIDLRELSQIVHTKLGRHDLSQKQLKQMMNEYDYKRSGTITFAGFLEMFSKRRQRAKSRFLTQLKEVQSRARVTSGLDGGDSILFQSKIQPSAPNSPRPVQRRRGGRTTRTSLSIQIGRVGSSPRDPLLESWIEESKSSSPKGKPPSNLLPGI